ncbi:Fcf1-domain-containing protein [Pseudomassariella vexata]|uniref:U three protein 23 n=1 Tax=Pseudomassariella vexata TaxID=1141098 RepID=A0A1Y2DEK2_9PEZI|nr:Fcf1-domain-containing protein [Pseudomassariella vexata]ORY57556.1 Fcf1-domain-containing protein [Pseudomassariella vexata]
MPRAKRSKLYRKLMERFSISFGFREPYQVLIDAELLLDASRHKIELVKRLEQTLHGQVKPLITQCCIRQLYGRKGEAGVDSAIELGKLFERRRCGHHPDQYPEPLSGLECLSSVVDPKDNGVNKFHYVVASNELEIRAHMRRILGVPLIYITRSVMIMEPMASGSVNERSKEERGKLRAEIKKPVGKRKRDDDDDDDDNSDGGQKRNEQNKSSRETEQKAKLSRAKGPNPLAVKKPKKTKTVNQVQGPKSSIPKPLEGSELAEGPKRKRKRKHKSTAADGETVAIAKSKAAPQPEAGVEVEA